MAAISQVALYTVVLWIRVFQELSGFRAWGERVQEGSGTLGDIVEGARVRLGGVE